MGVKTKLSIREASGAVSLVIVILFVQTVIFVIQPEAVKEHISVKEDSITDTKENSITDTKENSISLDRDSAYKGSNSTYRNSESINDKAAKFKFDPNTVSVEQLVELGLTQKQASVIKKYREKGGTFKRKEDLQKIYVLPDGFYDRVKDSIFIENSKNIGRFDYTANSKDINSAPQMHKEPLTQNRDKERQKNYEVNEAELSIELNQADSASLLQLPGIGPYYAGKIIEYRKNTGGLISANQLLEIRGIDSSRYLMFAHMVFTDTLKIEKKDLNKVTLTELSSNPYIGSYMARSIVRYREITGKEGITLAILVLNKVIAPEMLKKLKHYFN